SAHQFLVRNFGTGGNSGWSIIKGEEVK
ncbi:hypothetical protein U257_02712, partial [Staphylococcus aureus H27739]